MPSWQSGQADAPPRRLPLGCRTVHCEATVWKPSGDSDFPIFAMTSPTARTGQFDRLPDTCLTPWRTDQMLGNAAFLTVQIVVLECKRFTRLRATHTRDLVSGANCRVAGWGVVESLPGGAANHRRPSHSEILNPSDRISGQGRSATAGAEWGSQAQPERRSPRPGNVLSGRPGGVSAVVGRQSSGCAWGRFGAMFNSTLAESRHA